MSLMRLPIIRHGQTAWDKGALPQAEFDRRLQLVRRELDQRGLKALLVYSDMIHSGRAAYLINSHVFDPRMPSLVLVTADAFDGVLKVTARDLSFFAQFTEARLFNADFLSGDLSIKLEELAREHGLIGAPVGLVGADYMPTVLLGKVRDILGADKIVNGDDLLAWIQRVKSPAERALMKKAADLADAVLEEIAEIVRPGNSEQELSARADYVARMNGVQDIEFLIHTRQHSTPDAWPVDHFPFRPVGRSMLAEGEALGVFVAIQVHGYWVELSDTLFVGKPHTRQLAALDDARLRYAAMLRNVRPASNYRFGDNDERTAVWLHGTGTDRTEPPIGGNDTEFSNGDILAAHLALKDEQDVIFVGRQIAVSSEGGATLTEPARWQAVGAYN